MQKDIKRNSLESKLKKELEWYTLYASDEEYDEKAVESILYLLDRWEPLEEGTIPPVEESWKRFLAIADRKELLPVEDADVVLRAARRKAVAEQEDEQGEAVAAVQMTEQGEAVAVGKGTAQGKMATVVQMAGQREEKAAVQTAEQMTEGDVGQADIAEARRILCRQNADTECDSMAAYGRCVTEEKGEEAEKKADPEGAETEKAESAGAGKAVGGRKIRKLVKFAYRHKIIAAAVLVLMVLMVGNTVRVVAYPETGFFFWMKRDDSGVKMMTSPEGLDGITNKTDNIFYNKEDAPEWAKEWISIEEGIKMPENYEWQFYEANEFQNRKEVVGKYWNDEEKKEIVLGTWIYIEEVSYFKEGFIGYDYIQDYEINQKKVD
ncbi:MAG TPA: hypothetical protein DCZ91_04005, partial [Lachnospiraceae bacterium]|nr:hypothetical protein [Lachnospiraceae bacterium]